METSSQGLFDRDLLDLPYRPAVIGLGIPGRVTVERIHYKEGSLVGNGHVLSIALNGENHSELRKIRYRNVDALII